MIDAEQIGQRAMMFHFVSRFKKVSFMWDIYIRQASLWIMIKKNLMCNVKAAGLDQITVSRANQVLPLFPFLVVPTKAQSPTLMTNGVRHAAQMTSNMSYRTLKVLASWTTPAALFFLHKGNKSKA